MSSSKGHDDAQDDGVILVLTTTADDASAGALAQALVRERLAACVTRMAARSVYRWEKSTAEGAGKDDDVCDDAEVLLLIKSVRSLRARLEQRVLELHSYDCPEFVVIDPVAVEPRYAAWLLAACGGPGIRS